MDKEFFEDDRTATSPTAQATLFSSSFESWHRKHHKYPVYLPPQANAVTPLPVEQMTPRLTRAIEAKEKGCKYVRGVVARQLHDCGHDHCDGFSAACGLKRDDRHQKARLREPSATDPPSPHVDIKFDPDTSITKVTVSSFFPGVSREKGEYLVGLADPPKWPEAAEFFKEITRGCLEGHEFQPDEVDPDEGTELGKDDERNQTYQFREIVQWSWAPRLDAAGGMINILEIDRRPAERAGRRPGRGLVRDPIPQEDREDRTLGTRAFACKVLDEVDRELEPNEKPCRAEVEKRYRFTGERQDHVEENYDYRLVRCMQSKFISTWARGGIDLDDGIYRALWCPPVKGDQGGLFIRVVKVIRYTTQAEVFPGHAKILNLLTPAVASMFLREVAFDSVRHALGRPIPKGFPRLQRHSAAR